MAIAKHSFYSTQYGESYGYNEREGTNKSHFNNRYLNAGYRGSIGLGPTRFLSPSSTAAAPAAASALNAQTSPFQAEYKQLYEPTFAQTERSVRGVSSSRVDSSASSLASTSRVSSRASTAPLSSFGSFERGGAATSANVNQLPYYLPPPADLPHSGYAPAASSLGNSNYVFDTNSSRYPYSSRFDGREYSSKPLQDDGQSIPFGKQHAPRAQDILRASISRPGVGGCASPHYNLPLVANEYTLNRQYADKESLSRRLNEKERLRYHLPGYMGFVKTSQFRHGDTYGKTTRKCIKSFPL